ncbi:hypothetical protein ADK91_17725 [Streptomyces sp. XY511]|nr:hypothetical protein ADK91_17725 [Streptomyces sp. XY511]
MLDEQIAQVVEFLILGGGGGGLRSAGPGAQFRLHLQLTLACIQQGLMARVRSRAGLEEGRHQGLEQG